jgi:hypothetical protein
MNKLNKLGLEILLGASLLIANPHGISNAYATTPVNNSAYHIIRNGALASRYSTNNIPTASDVEEASTDLTGKILMGTLSSMLVITGLAYTVRYMGRRLK